MESAFDLKIFPIFKKRIHFELVGITFNISENYQSSRIGTQVKLHSCLTCLKGVNRYAYGNGQNR